MKDAGQLGEDWGLVLSLRPGHASLDASCSFSPFLLSLPVSGLGFSGRAYVCVPLSPCLLVSLWLSDSFHLAFSDLCPFFFLCSSFILSSYKAFMLHDGQSDGHQGKTPKGGPRRDVCV